MYRGIDKIHDSKNYHVTSSTFLKGSKYLDFVFVLNELDKVMVTQTHTTIKKNRK